MKKADCQNNKDEEGKIAFRKIDLKYEKQLINSIYAIVFLYLL